MAQEKKQTKKEVVEIIKEKGYQLKFDIDIPEEYRSDKDIIGAIIEHGSIDFDKLPDSAKNNREILILIASDSAWSFRSFPDSAKDDKEIALTAVKLDGGSFEHISDRLKSDRELVKLALTDSGYNLQYVTSKELLHDRELIKLALSTHDQAYMHIPEDLREDKEFIEQVMSKEINTLVFELFPEKYKNNPDVALKAVTDDGYSLRYLSEQLRDDKKIVLTAVGKQPSAVEAASERLRDDIDVGKTLLKHESYIYSGFTKLSDKVKNNAEIVLQAVARNGRCFDEINSEWRDNEELIRNTLNLEITTGGSMFNKEEKTKRSASCFMHISNRLKSKRDIALTASTLEGFSLEGSPEIIISDKEIIKNAITVSYSNIEYISSSLLSDKEFLMELYKINDSITYHLDESAKALLFSTEIVTSEHYGSKLLMNIVVADGYIKDQKRQAKSLELYTNNKKVLKIADFPITTFESDGPVGSYLSVRFVNNIVLAGEFVFYVQKNSGDETWINHTNPEPEYGYGPKGNSNDDFLNHKVYLLNHNSDIDISCQDLEKSGQILYFGKANNLPVGIFLFEDDGKYKEAQTILNQEKIYGDPVFEKIGDNRLKVINSEVEEVNGAARVYVDDYGWRWLIPNKKGAFTAFEVLKNTNDKDDWNWISENLKNITKFQKELIIRHFESSSLKDEVISACK